MGRISKNDNGNIVNGVLQLKKEFKRTSGCTTFIHKQVYHKDGWYVYQTGPNEYEVFKEKIVNGIKIDNGKMQKDESILKVKYPNDEDFGKWAWSVDSFKRAMKYIDYYNGKL